MWHFNCHGFGVRVKVWDVGLGVRGRICLFGTSAIGRNGALAFTREIERAREREREREKERARERERERESEGGREGGRDDGNAGNAAMALVTIHTKMPG